MLNMNDIGCLCFLEDKELDKIVDQVISVAAYGGTITICKKFSPREKEYLNAKLRERGCSLQFP